MNPTIEHIDRQRVADFIELANTGIPLIPIDPETAKPLWVGWQDLATANPHKVFEWARQYPALAVVTGRRCDVFDIEAQHVARMREVLRQHVGPIARSARGGYHLYTRPTGLGNPRLIFEGIHVGELKGRGGCCTCPPSVRTKGSYTWVRAPWDVDLVPAHPELLGLAPRPEPRKTARPVRSRSDAVTRLEWLAKKAAAAHDWIW
jgi:hypothetical protein